MAARAPKNWRARRFSEFCREADRRAGIDNGRALLSITKEDGVCLQAATRRRTIGNADLATYKVADYGEFALAPMALYYGAIGRVDLQNGGLVSPAYEVFRVDNSVSADFFAQLIRAPRMVSRYAALAEGGNRHGKRKNTSLDAFLSIKLPLPPLPEQRAIAEILSAIDETIVRGEALVGRLVVAKHAVMRQLLTRGHPAHRAKLVPLPEPWHIGRVAPDVARMPKGWKFVTLTDLARLESGHTPSRNHPEYWGGEIPWLSLPDSYRLKETEVVDADGRITPLGIQNSSARLLPAGTVILIRTGGKRGMCSRLGRSMATSQDFVGFVPKPPLRSRYLQQVFRHMQREWQRLSDGSTTLRNIFMPAFKKLKILLPPLDEQDAIAAVGESFDERILAEQHYLEQLRESKRGLAQALLTGRVRVPAPSTRRRAKVRSAGGS